MAGEVRCLNTTTSERQLAVCVSKPCEQLRIWLPMVCCVGVAVLNLAEVVYGVLLVQPQLCMAWDGCEPLSAVERSVSW